MSDLNFDIFTEQGVLPVPAFRKAVENSIYLLNQFDAGLSQKSRGILDWFVDGIHSKGNGNGQGPHHFSIHFISHLKESKHRSEFSEEVFAPSVTREFLHGVNEIETECETPRFLSENAMERVAQLGTMVSHKTATSFRFSSENESVDITAQSATNVEKLIGTKTKTLGTITGRLEELSIHNGFKARLYHDVTKKVVTCFFNQSSFENAKSAFGKLVYISGVLHKNINGDPIRITDPEIEVIEEKEFYNWERDRALPSFALADSTVEYMRRIRGD